MVDPETGFHVRMAVQTDKGYWWGWETDHLQRNHWLVVLGPLPSEPPDGPYRDLEVAYRRLKVRQIQG